MNRSLAVRAVAPLCILASAIMEACEKPATPPPPPATVVKGAPTPATAPATTSQPPGATTQPSAAQRPGTTFPPANQTPPDDPKVASFAGLTAPKPVTWIWQPPQRQFAVAEYAVPGVENADQARIVAFEPIGGTLEQNINRWKGQFTMPDGSIVEPKLEQFEVDGMPITFVELYGNYRGMGTAGFSPDTLFITAAIQSPQGQIFVRFIGPRITVEANREEFMAMIRGLKKTD